MFYRFTQNVTVDGKPFHDGDIITAEGIPQGCFVPLKRLRVIVEHKEQPPEPPNEVAAMEPEINVGPKPYAVHHKKHK